MLSNSEQKERNTRIIAMAGTFLLHIMAVFVLLNLALHTTLPGQPEQGIEVDLSYSDNNDTLRDSIAALQLKIADSLAAKGTKEPVTTSAPEIKNSNNSGLPAAKTDVKPKTIIETPLARIVNPKLLKPSGNTKPTEKPIQSPAVKPREPAKANQTPQPETNNADNKLNGINFQLGGRAAVSISKPLFNTSAEGRIVVSIIVNKEGKVIYATSANKGTTVQDIRIRIQAEDAARKSIFAPDKNAADEQKGIITFTLPGSK